MNNDIIDNLLPPKGCESQWRKHLLEGVNRGGCHWFQSFYEEFDSEEIGNSILELCERMQAATDRLAAIEADVRIRDEKIDRLRTVIKEIGESIHTRGDGSKAYRIATDAMAIDMRGG